MAHIAVFQFPAVGHVNPTVALVEELVARGHQVTCLSTSYFEPALRSTGATVAPYSSVFGDFYTNAYTLDSVADMAFQMLDEHRDLMSHAERCFGDERPDLIMYSFTSWAGRFYATTHNIPAIQLFPTYAANEHFWFMERFPLTDLKHPRMLDFMEQQNALIASFGIDGDSMSMMRYIEELAIVFLPRDFQYDGETFDERFVFAGPCLSDRSAFHGTWRPADPERPVLLISLGTASTGWPELFRTAAEAFGDTEWDVVMALGDHLTESELGELPANVTAHHHVPQLDVLDHASLFVTAGGMNSTMEALSHGVPMVVIPQTMEQTATALQVDERGLGRHLPREETNAESLRRAVAEVAGDLAFAERVRAMQQSMHGVDGPRVAADAVDKYLAEGGLVGR